MRLRPTCLALADAVLAFGRGPSAEGLGTGGVQRKTGERNEPTLKVESREKREGEEERCQKGLQEKFAQNIFVGPQEIFSKSSASRQHAVKLDSFCRFIRVLSPALSDCGIAGRELSIWTTRTVERMGRGWILEWDRPRIEPWLHHLPLQ